MREVPYPPNFRHAKTFYCRRCDRFALSSDDKVPLCPVHGESMVSNQTDPARIEPEALVEEPGRRPQFNRAYGPEDMQDVLRRTQGLAQILEQWSAQNGTIPVIHNTEDADVAHMVLVALVARGYGATISIPPPRYSVVGRLDPHWLQSYWPVLVNCPVAIYARRPNTIPNPGTQAELEILSQYGKAVIVYEQD
jgi:hypothetical protein